MSILSRLFRVGKSEANAVVDKMEDRSKMSDQILRELKENLQQAIEGEAEIKALVLGHRASEAKNREVAASWEKKATDLLDMIDAKTLDETKGNELASKAAESSTAATVQADEFAKMAVKEEAALTIMDGKIKSLRDKISETDNRAKMIKSRAKTAEVEEKIGKTLSSVDTDGLMSTLDRMEEKTAASEFRAQAYAEIDNSTLSSEQEIDKVLHQSNPNSALEAIKAKRLAK